MKLIYKTCHSEGYRKMFYFIYLPKLLYLYTKRNYPCTTNYTMSETSQVPRRPIRFAFDVRIEPNLNNFFEIRHR